MSYQRHSNSTSGIGCGFLIIFVIFFWALFWIFKIAMILLGVLAIIAAVLMVVRLVSRTLKNGKCQEDNVRFSRIVGELHDSSVSGLRNEMRKWNQVHTNKGVGTTLESVYFSNNPTSEHLELFDRVNELMAEGSEVSDYEPVTREDVIDNLERSDMIRVELEYLHENINIK